MERIKTYKIENKTEVEFISGVSQKTGEKYELNKGKLLIDAVWIEGVFGKYDLKKYNAITTGSRIKLHIYEEEFQGHVNTKFKFPTTAQLISDLDSRVNVIERGLQPITKPVQNTQPQPGYTPNTPLKNLQNPPNSNPTDDLPF